MQRRNSGPHNSVENRLSAGGFARSLFEVSPDATVVVTPGGRISDANEATVKVTGVLRAWLIGSDLADYFTEPERVRTSLAEVARGASAKGVPLEIRHVDGHLTAVLCSAAPFRNGKGEVEGVVAAAHDVTEYTRAAKALRASEERYRFLFERHVVGVFRSTADGRLLDCNQALAEMHGYASTQELLQHATPELYVQPADRERLLGELRSSGAVRGYEIALRHKDGGRRWVLYNASLVPDDTGELTVIEGTIIDIAQRKRDEESLRLFRELVDHANDAIEVVDPETGRYLDVNRRGCELHGYSREEYLTLSISNMDPRFGPGGPVSGSDGGQLRTAGSVRFEAEHRRKDGTVFPVEIDLSLVRLERDYLVAVVRDITERRRTEEERRRLVAALEQATEGITITDADGMIEHVNPAFEASSGYSRAEVVGQNIRALASSARLEELCTDIIKSTQRGGVWQGRFRWPRMDKSTLETDATCAPVRDASGAIVNFVWVTRDVTEQVVLEGELRQAQKMEVIARLAGGVAHDFNNLLQAMFSLVELIRSQRHDPGRVATLAHDLQQEVRRGASLTRQLLLFSRREASTSERLDLNEVVGSAAAMLRRLVRESVAVGVELAPGALPIEADRGQLDQVIMNLVVNASDAMPEGGRLTIRTGAHDRTQVWLAVDDTGHGIPEPIRQRIFEPFFTTKETGKGTGLGLAVANGIVAQHGGQIQVTSSLGQGSTFTVVLPRTGSAEHPAVEVPAAGPPELPLGSGERVLVVEDEAMAREALQQILASLGYQATAVGNGEDAGKLPAEPPFDVLLTDLMLPGIAGQELALGLRERWPALRVILMSGYTEDEVLRREAAEGSLRFLQKPFDMATLACEVRAVIDES